MPRFRDPAHTSRPSAAPRVVDPKVVKRTIDPAALEMLDVARERGVTTYFDRFVAQQPQCQFGYRGICCRFCMVGPCRIKGEEGPASKGACGAHAWTIAARSTGLMLLTGASAHSEHGHHIVETLHNFTIGKAPDYQIKDPAKLRRVCEKLGITGEGKDDIQLAKELTELAFEDFRRLDGEGYSAWLAANTTRGRVEKFMDCNVMPTGIYNSISNLVNQAHCGMDDDPVNLIFSAIRVALSDYIGEHIATDLSDILFGTPQPVLSQANMGVLDRDKVNIALYGHNPVLSEIICDAAGLLEDEARAAGAKGVNLVGVCCTGNEVLMRRGVKIVTSYASSELAIVTGVLDAMIVDVQCIMPAIRTTADCFHTKIVTTAPACKLPGSTHIDYHTDHALANAKEAIRVGIEAYRKRDPNKIHIPDLKYRVVAGFSLEALYEIFGAVNPVSPVSVLTDAILAGEIKGVAHFCGCNNIKRFADDSHTVIAREMLANDVFVIGTGCAMQGCAKAGLLDPENTKSLVGPGLARFLARLEEKANLNVPLPAVFHMGSCVDNSRIVDLMTDMANQLGVDTPKIPFVASAPEAMTGKAVAIGTWFVALGAPTHVGAMPPLEGSDVIYSIATQIASDVYGGYFIFEMDPFEAAKKILSALEYRTWKLGVHRAAAEDFETGLCQNY
ncbi:MAG: anaerobic carbon-monoxide dehydrogenase catalytic subunit [Peptococcaceae bacterium]|jgi:carbon-monoxide dehydrogenase catalytic subunit|nr:anaerobic carbon-monoxide dehydrogenase catalytic subunit [Peptococcaceae bacterium]